MLWGSAADIDTIFVLQKRAIQAIYMMGPRESLKHKFKEINILTLHSQYIYDNLVYVHKNTSKFKTNSDLHQCNLRNKNKLAVPASRLHKVSHSFVGQSIRFYNKLPNDMTNLSLNKFKKIVKHRLCRRAYYSIADYACDKDVWK